MTATLESWSGFQRGLLAAAVLSTLFFLAQFVLTLLGSDAEGMDAADDPGGGFFGLFTVRNAILFLMGFSWGGLALVDSLGEDAALGLGVGVGVCLVAAGVLIMKTLSGLRDSGNLDLHNAVGKPALVSVIIPGAGTGCGKVSVAVQGRRLDLRAVSERDGLPRGTPVRVVAVRDDLLVVER